MTSTLLEYLDKINCQICTYIDEQCVLWSVSSNLYSKDNTIYNKNSFLLYKISNRHNFGGQKKKSKQCVKSWPQILFFVDSIFPISNISSF